MWFFVDEPWQYRLLDQMPPGVDEAQLRDSLAMTPTERIESVVKLMEIGEEIRRSLAAKVRR